MELKWKSKCRKMNKKPHRYRKQVSGCRGWGMAVECIGVSLWKDENVSGVDG